MRGEFPYPLVAQMADMGLFGLPFPEEYGGMGGDYFALCLAIEELGRVDSSVAITLEAGGQPRRDADLPVRHRGAQGTVAAAAGAAARRSARSASPSPAPAPTPAAPRPRAELDGGEWVINGSKQFITNSGTDITGLVTVTAVTGEHDGRGDLAASWCPPARPG